MKPELQIFIPSRSRWEKSLTLERLGNAWPKELVTMVVPLDQRKQYEKLAWHQHGIKTLPTSADGIAAVRKVCGAHAHDKFLMLDDDLRFMYRPDVGPQLLQATQYNVRTMLYSIQIFLDTYAHVAISARQGNNHLPLYSVNNWRPLRALAYRKAPFMKCKHGRVQIMEDFDVTLQLIAMGYQNAVITRFTQDQYQTNLPGGCSDYRTLDLHETNVRKFASLHRDFVKLRQKHNIADNVRNDEFRSRLEVTIYWEKAWKESKGRMKHA